MTELTEPTWVQRYTATSLGFPSWTGDRPDRLAIVSNKGGRSQAWAHDLADGTWRRASDEPVGVEVAWMLPDGRIAWWRDTTGDERGRLVAVPFEGGDAAAVFPDIAEGWLMGLSFAAGRSALGVEIDGRYRIFLIDEDGATRELAAFERAAGVGGAWGTTHGGLSPDGRLVCIAHAEHGDTLHNALRVLDTGTGATVADLEDPGRNLESAVWLDADRLAFTSELGAFERPAIWNPRTGARHDIAIDVPGIFTLKVPPKPQHSSMFGNSS